ncbi:MAG: RluA family pseudouridine synthase [Anaerolineaceae bacterium]|nr:RluA family pseudouridine synthase [Anaerolineaceae bacterium]
MSEEIITLNYEGDGAERLDHFLADELSDYSRSRLQSFIKDGRVRVDGEAAKKYGQALVPGQMITVILPEIHESGLVPENIPLDIIYEDEQSIVINKPAGMVVHPAAGHETGTLVHAVLAHCDDLKGFGGEIRPGVVHRLDRDTSGIIVMAKNEKAHIFLQEQFKARSINKRYLALVDGAPPTPAGRVEAPIGRDPIRRQQMAIMTAEKGREAVTEYRTVQSYVKHTLIEAHPLTGRTHQIRVHMAFLKCPIVGDVLYGRRKQSIALNRHFLHAYRLTILLPGHTEPMTFEAPLPQELQDVIDNLQ